MPTALDVVRERSIRTVYQPIVHLTTGDVFAYEALTRGPDGDLAAPVDLFHAAAEEGVLFALELICRESALIHKPPGLLSVNVEPRSLLDPGFTNGMTAQALRSLGITASDVIFEVTERTAIENYSLFRQVLDHYRSQGHWIAVDDVGSGYSNLRLVAEVRPEIIKIDIGLVCGVSGSTAHRAAVRALAAFAVECGALAVAEGIESSEDLAVLQELGVPLGQGYLLGRPVPYPALSQLVS